MGTVQSKDTDGYTPICNECGVHLCWDISYIEYEENKKFWDNWKCEECDSDVWGSRKRFIKKLKQEQESERKQDAKL